MSEHVIRVTVRAWLKGAQEDAVTHRVRLDEERPGDGSAVVWAVKVLSGELPYERGYPHSRFTVFRPSRPGTDGSGRHLHYVDVDGDDIEEPAPYDQGTFTLKPHALLAPHQPIWIRRAWLEQGFTARERRQVYAALHRIRAAREWWRHEPKSWVDDYLHGQPVDRTEFGSSLELLHTGLVPGW